MHDEPEFVFTGLKLDEEILLSTSDLCRACAVHAEWIVELVEEGILEPEGHDPVTWQFRGPSLRRVQVVLRLQHDLGVNLAGAALVLDLMDELESLRTRLQAVDPGFER